MCGDTAVAVAGFQQSLRNDRAQGFGQHRAHHFFFAGREYVNDTVHGFGGTGGVQRAEYQVAGFSGGQREADGFGVAHLAHEDYIRVFTQCRTQGVGKAVGVLVQLALVDEGFFTLVDELDRVFDGEDVCGLGFVDVVDHRRQRGGFTGTGRAGYQYQAARVVGDFLENTRGAQVFQRQYCARNGTEDGGRAAVGGKCVDTETGDVGQLEGEVHFQILLEQFALMVVHDRSDHVADFFGGHFGQVDAADIAVNADHGGHSGA